MKRLVPIGRRATAGALVMAAAACEPAPAEPTPGAYLPNPASVHCEEQGGRLELRQDAAGGVAGVCVFADGSECDEWAFFRGECGPGTPQAAAEPPAGAASAQPAIGEAITDRPTGTAATETPAADGGRATIAAPDAEAAADAWLKHRHPVLGYRLEYPPDAVIERSGDPSVALLIVGPQVGEERWPMIAISHPADRPEFRPPAGADLAAWLEEHDLLEVETSMPPAEVRQPDTIIAGTTAIHTRFERSPHSYAYDKYYFAVDGQLYQVILGHVGGREDWAVYERFLGSIAFGE